MQECIDDEVIYYYDFHPIEEDLTGRTAPHTSLTHELVQLFR